MAKTPTRRAYPWAELYQLESREQTAPLSAKRSVGRPHSVVPRAKTTQLLTADERRSLAAIVARLQLLLPSAKISRGQAAGLAFRILEHQLADVQPNPELKDWRALVDQLLSGQPSLKR